MNYTKPLMIALVAVAAMAPVTAAHAGYVNGYTRSDGTYVQGYQRSAPDSTVTNNYGYRGNTNPYTGQTGSNSYRNSPSSQYYDGNPND